MRDGREISYSSWNSIPVDWWVSLLRSRVCFQVCIFRADSWILARAVDWCEKLAIAKNFSSWATKTKKVQPHGWGEPRIHWRGIDAWTSRSAEGGQVPTDIICCFVLQQKCLKEFGKIVPGKTSVFNPGVFCPNNPPLWQRLAGVRENYSDEIFLPKLIILRKAETN